MTSLEADKRPTDIPEGNCAFFLTRKRRFCRFRPNTGQIYCPEHGFVNGVELKRKRIPCPLDSKHSCYEDNLEKHLKKCNSKKKPEPSFYVENINSGDNAGLDVPEKKTTILNVSRDELQNMMEKVNRLHKEYVGDIELAELTHPCLRDELDNQSYGIPALRHRKQQASIIGHLESLGLLKDNTCYVELGAGKGQLSHWVQRAVSKHNYNSFLLIDRGHVRYKFDGYHKEESGPSYERIRIDIEHLDLDAVPSLKNNNRCIVGMGKHLCGPATDLALRCLISTKLKTGECDIRGEEIPSKKLKTTDPCRTKGLVIALCCHHRCTWPAYVGKEFMQQCGFSPSDFQLLTSLTSWASCSWKGWRETAKTELAKDCDTGSDHCPDTDQVQRTDIKLSPAEREILGRKSKQLLDIGRVKYLTKNGMKSLLKAYIDQSLTPENIVLLANSENTS